MIELNDVWKAYKNGVYALNGVSLQIKDGEFVYVVGQSGAGKSTLIRMLYAEERPTEGHVFVNGVDVSRLKKRHVPRFRRSIGVVFQDFKLLPRLTVYENVSFALEVIEISSTQIKNRVMNILDLVHLKHKARAYPHELSGGEQQRVSIARAIVNKPRLLIADEPTGNLDPDTSWGIMHVFENINKTGTTILMATHNKDIVNTLKKRVIVVENGRVARDELEGVYEYEA